MYEKIKLRQHKTESRMKELDVALRLRSTSQPRTMMSEYQNVSLYGFGGAME